MAGGADIFGGFLSIGVPPNHPYFKGCSGCSMINYPAIGLPPWKPPLSCPKCVIPWRTSQDCQGKLGLGELLGATFFGDLESGSHQMLIWDPNE